MKHDADYWKGFWAGRAIAVRLAGGLKAPESDWYLYNGVRLPKFQVWSTGIYPYVFITETKYSSYSRYMVVQSKTEPYKNTDDDIICYGSHYAERCYVGWEGHENWTFFAWHSNDGEWFTTREALWTNHDILNKDGSLYLAASEPIPTT